MDIVVGSAVWPVGIAKVKIAPQKERFCFISTPEPFRQIAAVDCPKSKVKERGSAMFDTLVKPDKKMDNQLLSVGL